MDKKLFRTLVFVFSLFTLPVLTAAAAETAEPDSEYTDLVTSITQVTAPYIKGDYLIFTAKPDSRFVGIAFDFEEFNKVHPYMKHNTYDENGEVEKSIFFYALKLSKNMQEIRYRIVVDGLHEQRQNLRRPYRHTAFPLRCAPRNPAGNGSVA